MSEGTPQHDIEINAGYRARRTLGRVGVYAALWVGIIIMIVPFFWMLSTSLKSPIEILQFPPTWIPTGHFAQAEDGGSIEVYVISEDRTAGTAIVRPVDGGADRTVLSS
ncbi:hypothetical protein KAT82_09410, partial [bacterium]|nr:hypothetical protein [bacterium]